MKTSDVVEDLDTNIADARNIIKARTKEIVNRYNRDQSIRKKIRKDIDMSMKLFEGDNFDGFDANRNVPKLICNVLEETDKAMTLILYDGSQPMKVALSSTIKNIRHDLIKDKMIKSLPGLSSVDIGNGDEGCLFVKFKS